MALTTDTTLKGDGFKFNVRSYKIERVIDFATADIAVGTAYEIGDLKVGFVPRAIALVELVKQDKTAEEAATVKILKKSGAAGSTPVIQRELGTAAGVTCNAAGELAKDGTAETLALVVEGGATKTAKIKVVIAGDLMTGEWDEGIKNVAPFDPAEHIPHTPAPEA